MSIFSLKDNAPEVNNCEDSGELSSQIMGLKKKKKKKKLMEIKIKLEQLECLHSEISLLPHDYPYEWFTSDPKSKQDKVKVTNLKKMPKIQILKFCSKLYILQTFWSYLIKCMNMKWI